MLKKNRKTFSPYLALTVLVFLLVLLISDTIAAEPCKDAFIRCAVAAGFTSIGNMSAGGVFITWCVSGYLWCIQFYE